MKKVVDVSAFLSRWYKEIELHKQKVKELEQKISVAQEMASMENVEAVPETSLTNIGESLASAIVNLLESKREWLGTGEIADELIKEGYGKRSKSRDYRLYVITTVPKIHQRGRIQKIKDGGRIKYGAIGLSTENLKPILKS